jgi:isopropylmalate/homocitrate/citramalate synthase
VKRIPLMRTRAHVQVACRQMVGVMLVVYVRSRLVAAGAVRVDFCDSCGVGLMGAAGNKVREMKRSRSR